MVSFTLLIATLLVDITLSKTIDIHWNSSNPIFTSELDNADLALKLRDKINFLCPYYEDRTAVAHHEIETSVIYVVSEFGYKNCLLEEDSKPVGQCRTPFRPNSITVVLREFTPMPGGLEFTPGQTYYFISTSGGSPLNLQQRKSGLCESSKMRLKIFVEPRLEPSKSVPTTTVSQSSSEESVDLDLQKLVLPSANEASLDDLLNQQQLWSATYQLTEKERNSDNQQDSPVTPAYYDRPQSDLGFRPRPIPNQPTLVLYHIEEVSDFQAHSDYQQQNSASWLHLSLGSLLISLLLSQL